MYHFKANTLRGHFLFAYLFRQNRSIYFHFCLHRTCTLWTTVPMCNRSGINYKLYRGVLQLSVNSSSVRPDTNIESKQKWWFICVCLAIEDVVEEHRLSWWWGWQFKLLLNRKPTLNWYAIIKVVNNLSKQLLLSVHSSLNALVDNVDDDNKIGEPDNEERFNYNYLIIPTVMRCSSNYWRFPNVLLFSLAGNMRSLTAALFIWLTVIVSPNWSQVRMINPITVVSKWQESW